MRTLSSMGLAAISICSQLVLSSLSAADTFVVHDDGTGDFPDIQTAIDAVEHGDVIELSSGTYYLTLNSRLAT